MVISKDRRMLMTTRYVTRTACKLYKERTDVLLGRFWSLSELL